MPRSHPAHGPPTAALAGLAAFPPLLTDRLCPLPGLVLTRRVPTIQRQAIRSLSLSASARRRTHQPTKFVSPFPFMCPSPLPLCLITFHPPAFFPGPPTCMAPAASAYHSLRSPLFFPFFSFFFSSFARALIDPPSQCRAHSPNGSSRRAIDTPTASPSRSRCLRNALLFGSISRDWPSPLSYR